MSVLRVMRFPCTDLKPSCIFGLYIFIAVDPNLSVHVARWEVYCSEMCTIYHFEIVDYVWLFPDIEATTWRDAVGIRSSASPLVFSAAPYLSKYHCVIQSIAVGVKTAFRSSSQV